MARYRGRRLNITIKPAEPEPRFRSRFRGRRAPAAVALASLGPPPKLSTGTEASRILGAKCPHCAYFADPSAWFKLGKGDRTEGVGVYPNYCPSCGQKLFLASELHHRGHASINVQVPIEDLETIERHPDYRTDDRGYCRDIGSKIRQAASDWASWARAEKDSMSKTIDSLTDSVARLEGELEKAKKPRRRKK